MTPAINHPTRWCPNVKSIICYSHCHRQHRVYPIRCKCWTCDFCYRKNLGALIIQLQNNPPDRFITLTCKRQFMESPIQCYMRHRPKIRKLFELARRKFGKQEYACFCEFHKSGFPHWHILQRGDYLPFKWLSATWEHLTGSKIVDIRRCANTRDVARYVTKYVTKSATHQRLDKRYRIVTFSKKFRPPRQQHRLAKFWSMQYDRRHPQEIADTYAKTWNVSWQTDHYEMHPLTPYPPITDEENRLISERVFHCTLDAELNTS